MTVSMVSAMLLLHVASFKAAAKEVRVLIGDN